MLNRVILIGRLTRDPEVRKTATSTFTTFSLAVNDGRKRPDGTENTLFMNCTLFGVRAETFAKYTKKGSLVSVEGRLNQRKYTNSNGVNVTTIETIVDNFDFLDAKGGAPVADDSGYHSQPAPKASASEDSGNMDSLDVIDDDLPF